MIRPRYGHKPRGVGGSKKRHLGNRTSPSSQAAVPLGGSMRFGDNQAQKKIDKWQAGADEIEAKMVQARTRHHLFEPMGTWDTCEQCGLSRAEGLHSKE